MKKIILLGVFFCVLNSCKQDSLLQIEQEVYQDIFPELVDKTFQDFRKLPVPPPPPYSQDMTNKEIAREYKNEEEMDDAFSQAREKYNIYIDTTDFAPLYVIVNDSAIGYSKKRLNKIHDEELHKAIFIDTTVFKKTIKIELSYLELGENYIIKHKSDLSKSIEELINVERSKYPVEKKHLWQYSGELNLTRVYFNKDLSYAFLDVGFYCGKLCGCSFRVYVKKGKEKWAIDRIETLGCA